MTDPKLIELLVHQSNTERNRGFAYLVNRDFTSVKIYVQKNSGSEDDAKDIFQDGLIALLKNLQQGEYKSSSTIKSYLFAICKNTWLQQLRKMKKNQELLPEISEENGIEEKLALEERYKLMKQKFSLLGEECQKILIQFYYDKKSMKELQEIYNLSSEQAAKNKKSRCLKKLSTLVS